MLNNKSDFSLLQSTSKTKLIAKKCAALGLSYCSIVDDNLSGVVEHLKAAKDLKLKPIVGFQRDGVAYVAKNKAGWQQLVNIFNNKATQTTDIVKILTPDYFVDRLFTNKQLAHTFTDGFDKLVDQFAICDVDTDYIGISDNCPLYRFL